MAQADDLRAESWAWQTGNNSILLAVVRQNGLLLALRPAGATQPKRREQLGGVGCFPITPIAAPVRGGGGTDRNHYSHHCPWPPENPAVAVSTICPLGRKAERLQSKPQTGQEGGCRAPAEPIAIPPGGTAPGEPRAPGLASPWCGCTRSRLLASALGARCALGSPQARGSCPSRPLLCLPGPSKKGLHRGGPGSALPCLHCWTPTPPSRPSSPPPTEEPGQHGTTRAPWG